MDPPESESTARATKGTEFISAAEWKEIRKAILDQGIAAGTRSFKYKDRIVPLCWEPRPLQMIILSFGTDEEADDYVSSIFKTVAAENVCDAGASTKPDQPTTEENSPPVQSAQSNMHVGGAENPSSVEESSRDVEEVENSEREEPLDLTPVKPPKARNRRKKHSKYVPPSTLPNSGTLPCEVSVNNTEAQKKILQCAMKEAGIPTASETAIQHCEEKPTRPRKTFITVPVSDDEPETTGRFEIKCTDEADIEHDPVRRKKKNMELYRELKTGLTFRPHPNNPSDLEDWKSILLAMSRQELGPWVESVPFRGRLVPLRWDAVSERTKKNYTVKKVIPKKEANQTEALNPMTAGASVTVPCRVPEQRQKGARGKHGKCASKNE